MYKQIGPAVFYIFFVWLATTIVFLFNFNLPVGYLAVVNIAFIVASYIVIGDNDLD
jgi:hypothetical protein